MASPTFRSAGNIAEANSTSVTCSYTLTAGDMLAVAVGHLQDAEPTSVVWNDSEAMVKIDVQQGGAVLRNASLYVLVGATAGAHNVVVTFAASNALAAVAFGYATTTAASAANKGEGTSDAPSLAITSPVGALALLIVAHSTAGSAMTMTNGTQRNYQESANFGIVICDRAGVGSTTVNGTITGETSWAVVGCSLAGTADAHAHARPVLVEPIQVR